MKGFTLQGSLYRMAITEMFTVKCLSKYIPLLSYEQSFCQSTY